MDRGEFVKGGFQLTEGGNGSWIVRKEEYGEVRKGAIIGFSNYTDFLKWLADEFEASQPERGLDPEDARINQLVKKP